MGAGARARRVATAAALADFYALGDADADPYLASKTALASGRQELAQVWQKTAFALAGARSVLDWGCRHGVFAWLARRELGADALIHGCDTVPEPQYAPWHGAAGLHYAQLGHPWLLPYAEHSFDVVLAGGTLEHVANDGASLDELWRTLQPGGRLVLTHLPNAGSWSEWLARRVAPARAHPRRYRLPTLRQRLLQRGFLPLRWGWHQMLPTSLPDGRRQPALAHAVERLYALSPPLERLWPVNRLSATLWLVAEKRLGF